MAKHDYYEINEIETPYFKYVLSIGPIDLFYLTLSKEQLTSNLKGLDYYDSDYSNYLNGFKNVDLLESFISGYVSAIEEEPHTIRYMCIPNQNNCDCDLVVIAKISNNGTCFVFSNNRKYLELIK